MSRAILSALIINRKKLTNSSSGQFKSALFYFEKTYRFKFPLSKALEIKKTLYMKPKADNLFHFTKSLDILKSILQHGIQPKYCLEDFEWFGWDAHKYLAFPISCFCDIPLSRIKEHTDFYGNYGIGLSKEWGFTNRLAPVIYTPQDSDITRLALFMFGIKDDTFTEKGKEEFNQLIFAPTTWVGPK